MERGGGRQTDKDKKVERDRTEKAGEAVTRKWESRPYMDLVKRRNNVPSFVVSLFYYLYYYL